MNIELRDAIVAFAHRLANNDSPEREYVLSVGGDIEGDESCENFGVSYMPWCECEMCQLIRLTLLEDGVDLSIFPQPNTDYSSDDMEEDYDDEDEGYDDDFWEEE